MAVRMMKPLDAKIIDHGAHATDDHRWYTVSSVDIHQRYTTPIAQFLSPCDARLWTEEQAKGTAYMYHSFIID